MRMYARAGADHLARSESRPSICRIAGTPASRASGTAGALPAMK